MVADFFSFPEKILKLEFFLIKFSFIKVIPGSIRSEETVPKYREKNVQSEPNTAINYPIPILQRIRTNLDVLLFFVGENLLELSQSALQGLLGHRPLLQHVLVLVLRIVLPSKMGA